MVLSPADAGKLTRALFIDLKKVFDTFPYDDLICKLRRFGLEENSLTWLTSYLTYGTHAVCVRHELSSPVPVLSGIPQGSILGRVPFTLYINDLPSCIQHHDNTVIYLSSTSTLDIELKLNLDLANLLCFLHTLIGYSISEYPALFTDSPPVLLSERRQTHVTCEQIKINAFLVCCRNKQRNLTTNQANGSRNTRRRLRSSV